MDRFTMRSGLMVAVLAAFVLAGCSSSKTKTEESEKSSEVTPGSAVPAGGAEKAEGGESVVAVTPANSVEGIWAQIESEQAKLSTTIQNGQLKDVHHLAFGIRDLVGALAVKANEAAPAGATRLNGMVELVNESAAKLDELGDAGNLSGTQAEFAKLEAVLSAIKSATGAK